MSLPIRQGTLENELERSQRVSSDTVILPLVTEVELRQLASQMRRSIDVRDRRYHLQNFQACFVGREAVNWLMENGHARDRRSAVFLGQRMAQIGLLHHVCDEHDFDDTYYYYRFNVDSVREQATCIAQLVLAKQVAMAQLCDCARHMLNCVNDALHLGLSKAHEAREFLSRDGLETYQEQIHWTWVNAQRHRRYGIRVALIMVIMSVWNWSDALLAKGSDNFAWGNYWAHLLLIAPVAHLWNCFFTLREWQEWGSEAPKDVGGDGEQIFEEAWGRIHRRYLRYFKTAYICALSTVFFFEFTACRSGVYDEPTESRCTKLIFSYTVSVTTCFLILVYYSGSCPFARRIGTCVILAGLQLYIYIHWFDLTLPRFFHMFCAISVIMCSFIHQCSRTFHVNGMFGHFHWSQSCYCVRRHCVYNASASTRPHQ